MNARTMSRMSDEDLFAKIAKLVANGVKIPETFHLLVNTRKVVQILKKKKEGMAGGIDWGDRAVVLRIRDEGLFLMDCQKRLYKG